MPEHVHLLVFPDSPDAKVEALLYAIKKPFSSHIKRVLVHERRQLIERLTVQERPGKRCFRLWQEGPGHDRNLISVENCVRAAEYMHNNPVRRRLCVSPDQWRWSSWAHYHCHGAVRDPALPRIDGFPP
jgi:putative transposase